MTSKEKTEFRKSIEWKKFRKQLLSSRPLVCECCGTATKRLSVHHKDPEHYDDLTPDKFSLLCSMCHKCVSRLERILPTNWGKYNSEWVALYSKFINTP